MRRRQLLATTAGLVGLTGAASGTRTDSSSALSATRSPSDASQESPTSTPTDQSGFGPLGQVGVPDIKEAVVGSRNRTVFAAVDDGFATIDVSDPAEPTVLAERRELLADRDDGPMRQVYDVKRDGNTLLVVGPANPQRNVVNAAVFYDVSDPANPERTAIHETRYPIHNCDFTGGVAYLTGNWRSQSAMVAVAYDGFSTTELSRWSIAQENAQWESVNRGLWTLHDITVQDDHAYLAHWDAGTWIVDVSDPSRPSLVSRVRGRTAADLAALEDFEARNESFSRPGNDHYTATNDDGTLLGIGVEAWDRREGGPGPGGITLYDISTPTEPQRLSRIEPPTTANATFQGTWTTSHNFDFDGERLYTSWYQGGVRVVDVSDPGNPTEIAAYRNDDETSFWTAVSAGEFFVAPSGEKQGENFPGRLYTFPDPTGNGSVGSGPSNPLDPQTETPTATAGPTTTQPTTTSEDGSAADTNGEDATTSGTGPGFGILGSLAAVGVSAWRLRRRAE